MLKVRFIPHLVFFSLLAFCAEGFQAYAQAQTTGSEAPAEELKEEKPKPSPLKRKKKRVMKKARWTYEQSYCMLGTASFGRVNEETTNPENRVYQVPLASYLLEFRPELVGSFKKTYKFVLRPRGFAQLDHRERESYAFAKQETNAEAFVNEAYFAGSPTDAWQYVIGAQNFQWGPAELASPSNPFFRDLGLEKTYFFETRGRALVRVNYSPSRQLSIIMLGEPIPNGEVRPQADKDFQRKSLIKMEYSDLSQTNYLGVTASVTKGDRAEFGAYGNYEVATAFTAYFDLMNRVGSRIFYPIIDETGASFVQNLYADDTRYTTAVLGLRYVTERSWDIRFEGFKDESAWTEQQSELARSVLFASPTSRALQLYLAPGSFFPGREFLYASLRIPDWGWKDSLSLSLRNLHSLTDNTEKIQATLDTYLNDHLVASTGLTYSLGPKDGQLTQAYLWQAYLSGAWIF